ncbi:MAG: winged helix-turn-helix transcriptional regulator [Candidatus Eremiobacteraeota bacterium]|nr:winged helix-turn-helix transcriptional regulator [Candidatus Eremiobacteraeota bacterium]
MEAQRARSRAAEGAIELESFLPYLVNRLAIAMINFSAPEFENIGVTVPQWRILVALRQHGECRVGQLVRITAIEPPTLSRLLGILEERKLLQRRRVQPDARGVAVTLRAAGKALVERTIPSAAAAEEMMTEGLSAADKAHLRTLLRRMFENVARQSGART